jgi:hypothetical protein
MITVESTEDAIHVTIPRGEMDHDQVEAIIRPLRFQSLVSGSKMTREEAVRMAEDSKESWWRKNEGKLGLPEGPVPDSSLNLEGVSKEVVDGLESYLKSCYPDAPIDRADLRDRVQKTLERLGLAGA